MDDNKEKGLTEASSMNKARLIKVFYIIGIILFVLIGRIYYIQIIQGEYLSQKAESQWFKVIDTVLERGTILDRNNIPLTNVLKKDSIIVNKNISYDEETIMVLSKVTDLDKETIVIDLNNNQKDLELVVKKYDDELMRKLISTRGISIIERIDRYSEDGLASHLIGYINKSKNTGESGLERYFQEELSEARGYKIGAVVDAQNKVLPGIGFITMKDNEGIAQNVVTTLDYRIQRIIENQLDVNRYKGSIVVLDGTNGDILALASRPNFNQNNLIEYLDSKDKELYNRGIQITYPPGSVFKILVAAAALENNIIDLDDEFVCKGYEDLDGNIIKCYTYDTGGHGILTFKEGFVQSCNSVFIQLGQMVGGESIIEMASRFNLGEKTGIPIEEEAEGRLPSLDYVKGAGIGNVSIGQGTLEVTPLQIARITNIILNDGVDTGINLVNRIVNDSGATIEELPKSSFNRIISENTSNKIKGMMKEVVTRGTGINAGIQGIESAGKTGSAEAMGENGEIVHGWFTGYFLGKKSKYVITIVIEDGESGGKTAAPIFKEIVTEMKEIDY